MAINMGFLRIFKDHSHVSSRKLFLEFFKGFYKNYSMIFAMAMNLDFFDFF